MTIFNKEFLSWYIITLKLKQTVDAGIPSSSRLIQTPAQDSQQQLRQSTESAWMITVRENLEIANKDDVARTRRKVCIYKVPRYLPEDKAYIPQIVSIGPYHHGKEHLRGMEHHKWRAFNQILRRYNKDAKLYLDSIKELEKRARECYEGHITISSNDFVQMMVLDGCFILELLIGAMCTGGFEDLGYSGYDPVFIWHGSMNMIMVDMIMLENQIPLFVLDRLYELHTGQPNQRSCVAKWASYFFSNLIESVDTPYLWLPFDPLYVPSQLHCLSVFRQSRLSRGPHMEPRRRIKRWLHSSRVAHKTLVIHKRIKRWLCSSRVARKTLVIHKRIKRWLCSSRVAHKTLVIHKRIKRWLCSSRVARKTLVIHRRIKRWLHSSRVADEKLLTHGVTELKEAGINFKKRKADRFWDIKFQNGVLKIPRILIQDKTKSLFLNLIAFEQSHLDCGNEIMWYVIFMDCLINSQEDVAYLRYCGILAHYLGSDADVADLFNRLGQGVLLYNKDNNYLSEVMKKVNRFYSHRWNRWRASLIHNYFSNPWVIISFVAAVILLILTAAQTFYTVYGFYSPPS